MSSSQIIALGENWPCLLVMALVGNWSVIALPGELAMSSSWGYGLCGDLAMSSI